LILLVNLTLTSLTMSELISHVPKHKCAATHNGVAVHTHLLVLEGWDRLGFTARVADLAHQNKSATAMCLLEIPKGRFTA